MEKLIAISNILSKQKIKQIRIISEDSSFHGKSRQLFEGLRNGTIKSDADAIEILGYKNINAAGYLKLKQRLLQRLINTVLFIDINQYSRSTYEKALHRSYRNWAAAKLILDRLQRKTAINIFESILQTALEFDLTDLILLIAKDLRRHYATFDINEKKTQYFDNLIEQNIQFTIQEVEVEKIYSNLGQLIIKPNSARDITIEFQSQIQNIKDTLSLNSRYFYNFYAYNAIYFYHYLLKENEWLEFYSLKAINFFQSKNDFSPLALFSFTQKLGVSYLHSSKIGRAKETFYKSLEMGPSPGSTNWYNIHSYIFAVHIMQKEYQKAYEVLSTATIHKKFNFLNERFKEPWLIKEAYIHFLIRMGKIKLDTEEKKSMRPFFIGRFLNEVPNFSKDKRGLNIAILIIQMLFLILDRKHGKVIDRIDALKQYSYRYLRKNDTFRANCFIKMLLKLPEADYHPIAVKRHTADLHNKLLDSSINFSDQSPEVEIIPYENLWEIVMELIEKR